MNVYYEVHQPTVNAHSYVILTLMAHGIVMRIKNIR